MSDEGEKTCPLCAEEMDLTDQQLKPCRCGYEICVWCWHHIMDMAEKDESEGRCPACRTAYDKDRIVGMAADCERLVQEVNMEKKHKSHKAKVKTSDSRKQLSSVRVIQRNLVYIVGLPLELADEDLLQHKDYFAQYGKVLKVSISRTSAGTIQQFANNTCSVYITYSKEEESIRCIQSVHGFILDARPLRACFGTTKYCHAWLRNVPCTNPDCLYLHEIGSLEDSFTKDEIISAYTRVQEITGVTNNMQRRAGTLLPPPADDYCNISSAVIEKPSVKNTLTNSASNSKGSPPNSSSGRSGALPPAASWGARVSNCNIPSVSLASSNGSTKQKAETVHEPPVLATIVSNFIPSDIGKKQMSNEDINANQTKSKMENPEMAKKHAGNSSQRNVSEVSSALLVASAGKSVNQSSCSPAISSDVEGGEQLLSTNSLDGQPCSSGKDKGNCSVMDGKIQKLCSDLSSLSTDKQLNSEHSEADRPNGLSLNNFLSPKNQGLQWHESERLQEHSSSTTATTTYSLTAVKEASDVRSDMQASVLHNMSSETEDDFNNQRLRDAIVINQAVIPTSSPLHLLSHLRAPLQSHGGAECAENYTAASSIVNRLTDECLTTNVSSSSVASNGFLDCFVSHTPEQDSSLFFRGLQGSHMGRFDGELPFVESQPALDMGENNIISNILSLDLDSWDDSLTSPQNLAKLLSETEKPEGTVNIAGSFKGQYSNQSRFSFARQEDSRNHLLDMEPSLGNIGQAAKNPPFGQEFHGIRDPYFDRMGNGFGFPHWNIDLSDNLTSGHSIFPTNKLSLSRSQISAPPGFSAPSRPPPPPGFSSHERSDQTYDLMKSGNHVIDTPSFCRNPYQTPPSGNVSLANDIEFIDPAILAVGKGRLPGGINNSSIDMRSNYPVQPSAFENDSRLQLLMQRSLSPHQNLRYTDVRDNFSPPNDAYGFSSRYMDQSQVSNHVPFSQFSLQQPPRNTAVSNGHWDNWSELQSGNDIGIAELLRNERLGNKFYGGYEDAKFRMTNSGDIYNRSFGM